MSSETELAEVCALSQGLAAKVKALEDALIWMSGASAFSPGEEGHAGWLKVRALLNSTPSADLEAHDARVRRECWELVRPFVEADPRYGVIKNTVLGVSGGQGVKDE